MFNFSNKLLTQTQTPQDVHLLPLINFISFQEKMYKTEKPLKNFAFQDKTKQKNVNFNRLMCYILAINV